MSEQGVSIGDPYYFQSLLESLDTAIFRACYFHPSNCDDQDRLDYAEAWKSHLRLWEKEIHDLLIIMKIPKFAATLQKVIFDLEYARHDQGYRQKVNLLKEVSNLLLPILVEKDLSDAEIITFRRRWEYQLGAPEGYCSPLVEAVPVLVLSSSYLKWSIRTQLTSLRFIPHQSFLEHSTSILENILDLLSRSSREFSHFVAFCQQFPPPPMKKYG